MRHDFDFNDNDWFFEKWEGENMRNDDNKFFVAIIVLWALSALASLAVCGVIIWAIIELVQWGTTK